MPNIQILGSAAAEAVPAIFCECALCANAWKQKDKDVRMRTAYKLNDRIRIDFGPDSIAQEFRFELHSERLRHLLISHSHEDHFYPWLLEYRSRWMSQVSESNILRVYGGPGVMRAIEHHFGGPFSDEQQKRFRMEPVPLTNFVSTRLEEEDFEFTPLPANHMAGSDENPQFYLFRVGDRVAMIANDTGYFPDETWAWLEQQSFRIDLVISDCTHGTQDVYNNHMGGKCVLDVRKRLSEMGRLATDAQYFVNHFSHNCGLLHAELEAYFHPHGIQVGFDGLTISF